MSSNLLNIIFVASCFITSLPVCGMRIFQTFQDTMSKKEKQRNKMRSYIRRWEITHNKKYVNVEVEREREKEKWRQRINALLEKWDVTFQDAKIFLDSCPQNILDACIATKLITMESNAEKELFVTTRHLCDVPLEIRKNIMSGLFSSEDEHEHVTAAIQKMNSMPICYAFERYALSRHYAQKYQRSTALLFNLSKAHMEIFKHFFDKNSEPFHPTKEQFLLYNDFRDIKMIRNAKCSIWYQKNIRHLDLDFARISGPFVSFGICLMYLARGWGKDMLMKDSWLTAYVTSNGQGYGLYTIGSLLGFCFFGFGMVCSSIIFDQFCDPFRVVRLALAVFVGGFMYGLTTLSSCDTPDLSFAFLMASYIGLAISALVAKIYEAILRREKGCWEDIYREMISNRLHIKRIEKAELTNR